MAGHVELYLWMVVEVEDLGLGVVLVVCFWCVLGGFLFRFCFVFCFFLFSFCVGGGGIVRFI